MQKLFFWRHWPRALQFFYGLILLLIAIAAVGILYFDLSGLGEIIGWNTLARTEQLELPIQQFQVNLFEFTTELNTALFWQYFDGGTIQVNMLSYYLFLFFTVLSMCFLITVISDLKGFWYFVGASLLLVALVNYKFELIYLFGRDDKTGLIIAFLLYIPATYYFNRVNPSVSLWKRFIVILGITALLGLLIHYFAEVDKPFFYLATSGMLNPMVISLVFILMIAHEIMIALVYVITSSNRLGTGKNLQHFLIISAIYLVNLLLAYMYEAHIVEWNLIYINLFVLLLISGIVGLWGYKLREPQYKYLFAFNPTGALFYAAMFLCCVTTIAHFYATANDPAIEVFRDVIIYSHLGFGIIFLIYILANFITPFGQNMAVHRILFSPPRMPYFTFRLAGTITFLAFVFAANIQVPVRQGTAAYYNGLGDMYAESNEWIFALRYYEEAATYGYNNHKANYALGRFFVDRKEYGKAITRYRNATLKWPTPQSYVNLSATYLESDRLFDALFTLREGLDIFPENYQLHNNLGLIYNRTDILDSAYYFLNQARDIAPDNQAASGNVIGLLAKNVIDAEMDSVLQLYGNPEDPITLNNTLVWKNTGFEPYEYSYTPPDSILNFLESYLLYNTALNHLYREDSLDTRWLSQFILHPSNAAYRDNLETASAFNLYRNHQVNRAFRLMNWLVNRDPAGDAEPFIYIGKWAMQQESPDVAAEYFGWAIDRNVPGANYLQAIALSENQDIAQAVEAWQQVLENAGENTAALATYMLQLYAGPDFETLSDQSRYHLIHFTSSQYDSASLRARIDQINDPDFRARTLLDVSRRYFEKDKLLTAIQWFDLLAGQQVRDEEVFSRIRWYELELLAAQNNIRGLARQINDGITFGTEHEVEKNYYAARIQESSGDTAKARLAYEWLAWSNPFNEEATVHAARFLGQTEPFEEYDILLNALEVNPRSVKLLKAYIFSCADLQFNSYAEISLETLRGLVSPDSYREIYSEFLRRQEVAAESF